MLGLLSLNTECKWLILLKQQQQIRKQYKPKTNPESEMHLFSPLRLVGIRKLSIKLEQSGGSGQLED